MPFQHIHLFVCTFAVLLAFAGPATAQTTFVVADEGELISALDAAQGGDTIQFTANITLTAELPGIWTDLTIDGGGFTLSGANAYRGLVIGEVSDFPEGQTVSVTIQNMTIANTVASGGTGEPGGEGGGGGGGGFGGAIVVGNEAVVTLSFVNIIGTRAIGGSGGDASGGSGTGFGGSGIHSFGWGGTGGATPAPGEYGGGGGGTMVAGAGGGSLFGGGTGSTSGGGGGGAGLGGAIFVTSGGTLVIGDGVSISGNSVAGGAGSEGGGDGSAYGSGLFLHGSGNITFSQGAGATTIVNDAIVDGNGASGGSDQGRWSLSKEGAGTLVLGGANLYSGGTDVGAGTLSVASDSNLGLDWSLGGGEVTVRSGAILQITGDSTFTRGLYIEDGSTIRVGPGISATWDNDIADSDAPAALLVTGGGTLTLGAERNSFSNGLAIVGNTTVQFADEAALGAQNQGVQLGDASSGGTLRLTSGTVESTRNFTFGGVHTGTFDVSTGAGMALSGQITGLGALAKAGGGTLVLSGANGYTGGTEVLAGTLQAGAANVFGAGRMVVQGGATLALNNFSHSVGSLAGAGIVSLGSGLLTTGGDNTSTTFSGVIGGTGGLFKTGTGSLTLTGANTYSGGTTVLQGVLIGTSTSLQGNIANNASVVFDQAFGGTYAGVISGGGALTKTGGGSLTLSGANTYGGGTTVSQGTLIGTSTSLQGNITNNASVVFDQGFAGTYAGAMSGAGALTKSGGGVLTLSGANTYTGGTTVTGGILLGNSISLQGGILNNAHVIFAQGFNGAYSGSMSGSGLLEKTGGGTLTLTGTNTHTGGTLISQGAIVGTPASLSGLVVINGALIFGGGGAFAGTLAGTGSLTKTGAGTLALSGSHAFAGLTHVAEGTLALNGQLGGGLTVAPGALFSGNGTIGGSVFLLGSLSALLPDEPAPAGLSASAAFTLTAGQLFSTPQTTTGGGDLVAEPAVGPGFSRDSADIEGSDLAGNSLSTMGPGGAAPAAWSTSGALPASAGAGDLLNTPPILTIGGNFVAEPGSVLALTIGPGPFPSLLVGGTASLDGTLLDVTAIDLGLERRLSFLAMTALEGLTVENSSVITANPLLVPALKQDGTSLIVTLLNFGVPLQTAVDSTFASVGGALDNMKRDMTGDKGFVIRELLALDDDGLNDAIRVVAGEIHASSRHLAVRGSEAFTDLVRSQLAERDREAGQAPGWGGQKLRWWGQFSREHGSFDSRNGARGGTMDRTDGAGGFDVRLSNRWLVGGGGGFGVGSLGLDRLGASSEVAAPRAFGVVGFKPKGFGIRGGGSLGRSKASSKRTILIMALLPPEFGGGPLSGGIDRLASTEEVTVQSDQWSEYADNFDYRTYRFDVTVGVRRARFARDGFTESGAGALSLGSEGETFSLNEVDAKLFWWRREGSRRPYIETLIRRSSKWPFETTMHFVEDRDSQFEAQGLPMGSNSFATRAGMSFVRAFGTLTFEYRIRKSAGQLVQAGDVRFRF
jgi:autotransporter-associated beta strand protein